MGILKGYDQLLNLVLDEASEYLRGKSAFIFSRPPVPLQSLPHTSRSFLCAADPEDPLQLTDQTRSLGLIVCRGTSVMTVIPGEGTEEIENPFIAQ